MLDPAHKGVGDWRLDSRGLDSRFVRRLDETGFIDRLYIAQPGR
jgi:hypothetical protein